MTNEPTVQKTPDCYGLYWEAIPGTEDCVGCAVKDGCLDAFATGKFRTLREQIGNDLRAISEASKIKPEALLLAMEREQQLTGDNVVELKKRQPVKSEEPEDPEEPTVPIQIEEEPDPVVEQPEAEQTTKKKTKKKAPTKSKKSAAKTDSKQKGETEKAKAPKKKRGAKKKPPGKPSTKGAAGKREVENPRLAGAVKCATAPAFKKQASKAISSVKDAKARASVGSKRLNKRRPKGETEAQMMLRRWLAEREKSPELGAVVPGAILRGTHKGKTWEVRVFRGRYVYKDQTYGTLQAVCNAITGLIEYPKQMLEAGRKNSRPKGTRKMSNWSAKRFFSRAIRDLRDRSGH